MELSLTSFWIEISTRLADIHAIDASTLSEKGTLLADGIAGIGYVIAYLTSAFFFMTGLVKIKKHRTNPQQIHLSMVITDFFVALCMFGLPFFAQHSNAIIFGLKDNAPYHQTNLPNFNTPEQPPDVEYLAE